MSRQVYAGQGLSAIDAKGRVSIPANLRAILEANSDGRTISLAPHATKPCLVGHDRAWLSELDLRLKEEEARERAAGRPFDYYAAAEDAFGQIDHQPYDGSGRFVLPAFHRQKGKLEDLAFFHGSGPFFMIWNPRLLLADPAANPKAAEGAAFFMAEKGLV